MSEMAIVQIIALVGWLVIVGSAYASYQMSWGKTAQYALTWVAIFGAGFVIVSFLTG